MLVDIPKDVRLQRIAVSHSPAGLRPGRASAGRRRSRQAAQMMNRPAPILYLGGGVVAVGAAEAAMTLAEQASLPTTPMTLMALGAMPWITPCRWACWACTARRTPIWRWKNVTYSTCRGRAL